MSAADYAEAAGPKVEQSFYGFGDVGFVIPFEMPSGEESAFSKKKSEADTAAKDICVLEINPEVEFCHLTNGIQRVYYNWTKSNNYAGPGSSDGHPMLGLIVLEQSHALESMPVLGIGQVCRGDTGCGKMSILDVVEKHYHRPWTTLKVSFSHVMDANRATDEGSSRGGSRATTAEPGERQTEEGESGGPASDESGIAPHVNYFRVAHIQPVLDRRLLHEDTLGIALKEYRRSATS